MRRWLKLGGTALVLLAAADTALWFWATGRVIGQVDVWAGQQRAQGWQVQMGLPTREGWPFEARIRVGEAAIASPPRPARQVSRLEADSATIAVPFWTPYTLHVGLHGAQRLLPGGGPALAFTSARTELTLPLVQDQPPQQADLAVDGLNLRVGDAAVTIAAIRLHTEFPPGHSAASLQADMVGLPSGPLTAALGAHIEHVGAQLAVDGPTNATPAAWKAAGGALHLASFELHWGKLAVTAHGDGQLDQQFQPQGSLVADVTGTSEALDGLVAAHLVPPNAANAARAVLMLMQRPQASGGGIVELPFTLKRQRLQMGQFPLLKMPDIAW